MAIGTGKSTMSKIMGLYYYHRLDCTSSVYEALSIAGGTKLAIGFYHNSELTARKDFLNYYKLVFEVSPYFQHLYNNPPIRLIAAGAKSKAGVIGTQLIFSVLSELSFWNQKDGVEKVSEILTRYESRFKTKRYFVGGVVCDSSANMDDSASAVEKFKEGVDACDLYTVSPSLWTVRPELFSESKGKTFKFYRGDAVRAPYCIEDESDIINNDLDTDRIIDVPVSAKPRFLLDPCRALKDLGGYTYSDISDLFFHNDLSHLIKCSSLRNLIPEIITVDFYNKNDSIFDQVSSMVYRIPRGTTLFLHFDLALYSDIAGVAATFYTGETTIGNASFPTFKIPFIFGVSRKKGQATSLDHMYQFIKDLIKNGYYVSFSADSFASAGILQSCDRDGIEYKTLSVDRSMDAGIAFKNAINTGRIEMPRVERLLREASELRVVGTGKNGDHIKLDHPAYSSCTMFDNVGKEPGTVRGSKDLFDCASASFFNCLQKYSEYKEGGVGGGIQKSMQAIDSITKDAREEAGQVIQNMIESIF